MNNFKEEQFADIDIRNILSDGDDVGAEQVGSFLQVLLSLYVPSAGGKSVKSILVVDWQIVADEDAVGDVLVEANIPLGVDTTLVYRPDIEIYEEEWEKVKEEVKKERRFFCNISPIEEFTNSLAQRVFFKDHTFYRGRVHHSKEEATFKKDEMGCPKDVDKIKAGRANPQGIAYLYLCTDQETPFYEIRSSYLDRVDIGEFRLNQDIRLVDFTQSKRLSLFNAFCEGDDDSFATLIKQKVLFEAISRDISAPMHSYDTELEYIPTQYICEYFKVLGFDGIMFTSSQNSDGTNLVLFNSEDAECVDVKPYEVSRVTINMTRSE